MGNANVERISVKKPIDWGHYSVILASETSDVGLLEVCTRPETSPMSTQLDLEFGRSFRDDRFSYYVCQELAEPSPRRLPDRVKVPTARGNQTEMKTKNKA